MFNIANFLKLAVPTAIFLVPIIMAITTGLGDTFKGIKGKWQFVSALLVGMVLGVPTFWAVTSPKTPIDWFAVALFALICGLTASGRYNVAKAAAVKANEIIIAELDEEE